MKEKKGSEEEELKTTSRLYPTARLRRAPDSFVSSSMGRHAYGHKQKLRKGLWSPEEDEKLVRHITMYGHGCWSSVPKQAGLQRCGKSCRLRWINYLRPDLKRGLFSEEEEKLIVELHKVLGNRWSQIASRLPGRTDNEIKNFWNSCVKKKLRQSGIDPSTHKPLAEAEDDAAVADDDKAPINSEKTSDSSDLREISAANVENSSPPLACRESSDSPAQTKGLLFSDQFISCQESLSCFSLPQPSSFSRNPLWLSQLNQEFNCNTMFSALPSMLSRPNSDLSEYSSGVYSSSSSWSSMNSAATGIELQSSSSFDSGIFPWSELVPARDVRAAQLRGESEELKWAEYLQGAFPFSSAALQSQPLHCDIKTESRSDYLPPESAAVAVFRHLF